MSKSSSFTLRTTTESGTQVFEGLTQAQVNRVINVWNEVLDRPFTVKRVQFEVQEERKRLCSWCDDQLAEVECRGCGAHLCKECDTKGHVCPEDEA